MKGVVTLLFMMLIMLGLAQAQADGRLDLVRPDAPELAAHGPFSVGVRTLELSNPDQLDILNAVAGEDLPSYDRPLTVEVWYPASLPEGGEAQGSYTVITRDGVNEAVLIGLAVRDAEPDLSGAPYPLIIVSHGYPGNRYLLAHFGENLATKGYVLASIDHTDSTYSDQGAFASTLLNRPLDQLFVLDEMARLGSVESGSFLAGLLDADNTGFLGYSMGGYGVINVIGGGFSETAVGLPFAPPNRALAVRQAGNEAYLESLDARVKAAVVIGPWGMQAGFWDAEGLAGITTPVLIMAGSVDDVSDYERGIRRIFENTVNAERYLLTFENANHNAAAPIPAPREVWAQGTFGHYADPVWDTLRMNNIAQHFATAFFDLHLKGEEDKADYLDLLEDPREGVWDVDSEGNVGEAHTYWRGFPNRTAAGLRLERGLPAGD